MCGIVGSFSFRNSSASLDARDVVRMRDSMAHRGPDGSGIWSSADRRVVLGHRRLSIVDLSNAAAQPMSNHDGTVWVTFNGEIYNHAEIRAELQATGDRQWKTDHSDTEVLVHAFERWGIDCVKRFRGMFAFALWDVHSRELWLVRDRVGIKPLYYSIHHGRITFASEIRALLQDPDQVRAVNEQALYHYLSFLTTPAPETLFEGIRKLPGGCLLRVSEDDRVSEQRYWDVWDHTEPLTNVSDDEIAQRLLAELRTSVKLRKMSDVPVGVFLSGGIDSSSNAALFNEGDGHQLKTFSIGYDADYATYTNELHYARAMAQRVGAEHHERLLSQQDLLDFLPQMIRLQDEPIADPVCVPVYFVSKLARDNGVIVCQLGEGADELFCGYPAWKRMLALARWNDVPVPNLLKRAGLPLAQRALGDDRMETEFLRRAGLGQPVFWSGAEAFTDAQKQDLLSASVRQRLGRLTSWEAIRGTHERFKQKAWEQSHLNWMSYTDLNLRLPELLLMRVDKMSMGVSLEGRVPFLDHKFVELAMSIPTKVKLRNGTLKSILKRAVRGVIPDEIIDRKKQGFGVPVYEWLGDTLGDVARQELRNFCSQSGLLDAAAVEKVIGNSAVTKRNGHRVWFLLNLALWWKEYIAQGESATLPRESVGAF
jgi:asparagine synthase (glutamine-hydrolysing)